MKVKETAVSVELKCILKEEDMSTYSHSISVYQQISCIELTQVLIKYHLVTYHFYNVSYVTWKVF